MHAVNWLSLELPAGNSLVGSVWGGCIWTISSFKERCGAGVRDWVSNLPSPGHACAAGWLLINRRAVF